MQCVTSSIVTLAGIARAVQHVKRARVLEYSRRHQTSSESKMAVRKSDFATNALASPRRLPRWICRRYALKVQFIEIALPYSGSLTPMSWHFLCLSSRDLENHCFATLCTDGGEAVEFYRTQRCYLTCTYCGSSSRP